MSPHAVVVEDHSAAIWDELAAFGVTQNAFLPSETPLKQLPDPFYQPWESIAQNLPQLIDQDRIRAAVNHLPLLPTARLTSEAEWRRAYVILAYITHAYVWGGDEPQEILPPQITVPFLAVSKHLDLPPVLTYAAACLWNFYSETGDFTNLEELHTPISFTGSRSESWFLLISVAMEARAAGIIQTMMDAVNAVKTRDYDSITESLRQLQSCITQVGALLDRMYERCDPMTFYHQIRPLMAGSKNMEAAGLPRGVFYDEENGKGEWMQLRGGSNGQSSLIQFFDVVLGVEHTSHGNKAPLRPGERSYHDEVRDYMPGPHRRFLTHVARMGSIRELALLDPVTEEQRRFRSAYTAATDALTEFRNKHIQIVTRYIILPSKQPWTGNKRNLASSSAQKMESTELTGTGGTMLVPFLKQVRDDTTDAGSLS